MLTQDNVRLHVAKWRASVSARNCNNGLTSPDVNPIEHIWDQTPKII